MQIEDRQNIRTCSAYFPDSPHQWPPYSLGWWHDVAIDDIEYALNHGAVKILFTYRAPSKWLYIRYLPRKYKKDKGRRVLRRRD